MRIRTTAIAVSGALALSAFAVPTVYAADEANGIATSPQWAAGAVDGGPSAFGAATAADATAGDLDVSFSGMKVNGGKPIVVGATKHRSVPVTYTLTHAADVDITAEDFANGPFLYLKSMPGSLLDESDVPVQFGEEEATCTATSSTTAGCKASIELYPGQTLVNSQAATWKVGGLAFRGDPLTGDLQETWQGKLGTAKVQRQTKLTGANASPEPVKKGKTITVTSKLTRASWDTEKFPAYGGQSVKLQFKKAGTSTYTDVKTVKTSTTGALKTTVKASADGSYRYVFAGSSGTAAVTSAADAIDVK
ncbi:hypothetical protein ACH470_17795 [Streptomyces bottropensis]|uniref:hypothetical protein n=1 Tax=Streptomyces bottropensis TaxID=42235 RepID=UPI00379E9F27